MQIFQWAGLVLLAIVLAVLGAGRMGLLAGASPTKLGVVAGRLNAPSKNPNSVSSQADQYPEHRQKAYAAMAPIRFGGDGRAAMEKLAKILADFPGMTIIKREPDYIYAECRTPILRFTDDVEFLIDPAQGVIHFRSASRLGRKDFGTNRKRMEAIRLRMQS